MTAKYEKLMTVISYFMDQHNHSIGDMDRFWIMGFRGLREIYRTVSAEPKTLRLTVNGNGTVTLPDDYIKWSKIGALNGDNTISTFAVNNNMTTWQDTSPNRIGQLVPDIPFSTDAIGLLAAPYFLNFWNNGTFNPMFGTGNGLVQYSEIKVDERNGVIILGPNYPFDDLYLEYLSAPEKDVDYMIDTDCTEALIAFLEWKTRVGTENDFYNRLREARRKISPITLQEINQVLREGHGFKVKA